MSVLTPISTRSTLEAQHPQIAVFPRFCGLGARTLVLEKKASTLGGGVIRVKDQDSALVVGSRCIALHRRDKKVLSDGRGRELCRIRTKQNSIRTHFIAEAGKDHEVFRVTKEMAFGYKMSATFVNASTGLPVVLVLKGDMWRHFAEVRLGRGGPVVAAITRQSGLLQELMGCRRYTIEVAPGVDTALLAAICICYCADEAKGRSQVEA